MDLDKDDDITSNTKQFIILEKGALVMQHDT